MELLRFGRFAPASARRTGQEQFAGEGGALLLAGNALYGSLSRDDVDRGHGGRTTGCAHRHRAGWTRRPRRSDLGTAMDMIAERVVETRARTWQAHDANGRPLRRTLGMAGWGGARPDTEENDLIKKGFTAAGAVSIENQARI
ncbi:hypothetical protein FSW04_07390 [Baekduia soli]|uniref:Uncharacterized protein n=1 Tax=Baekduia soli TaxID=496014 RepID=A0A5B8U3B1_9ACTN|nr:hypothetical protein FSW04_07390 [Baekduia soli]